MSLVDRGVTEKQSCILHFLANAIKERADAVISEDFELAMKGWKDAKELWDEIVCDIPAPLSRKMIAEGDKASTIFGIFNSNSKQDHDAVRVSLKQRMSRNTLMQVIFR